MIALARAVTRDKKKNAQQKKQQARHWITSYDCCAIGIWLADYHSASVDLGLYCEAWGHRKASSQDEHEFNDTITGNLHVLLYTEATLLQDADRANVMLHYVSVERTICQLV